MRTGLSIEYSSVSADSRMGGRWEGGRGLSKNLNCAVGSVTLRIVTSIIVFRR